MIFYPSIAEKAIFLEKELFSPSSYTGFSCPHHDPNLRQLKILLPAAVLLNTAIASKGCGHLVTPGRLINRAASQSLSPSLEIKDRYKEEKGLDNRK